MTDGSVRCVCGEVWATVRTFDGTVFVIQRHLPGCPLIAHLEETT